MDKQQCLSVGVWSWKINLFAGKNILLLPTFSVAVG